MLYHRLKYGMTGQKHGNVWKIYGATAYSTSQIFGVKLNLMENIGQASALIWFFYYHNNLLFGLSHCYSHIENVKMHHWEHPTKANRKENAILVTVIKEGIYF